MDTSRPLDSPTAKQKLRLAAIKFGKKYRSAEKRLEAIMKNVIKNNGSFEPAA
jgi:hypothetical protein